MHTDLTLLHSSTFVSLVTELSCALDHSSNAFALAHGASHNRVPFDTLPLSLSHTLPHLLLGKTRATRSYNQTVLFRLPVRLPRWLFFVLLLQLVLVSCSSCLSCCIGCWSLCVALLGGYSVLCISNSSFPCPTGFAIVLRDVAKNVVKLLDHAGVQQSLFSFQTCL